jgi:flagellar protein FlaG
MFSIDAAGGPAPAIGLPEPRKTDGPSHVVKTPPASAEEPGAAVAPPQQGEDTGATRARTDQVEQLAERLNREFAQRPGRSSRKLRFLVEPRTQELIVQVIDGNTEKVVGQFPPEEVIQRMKTLEALKGLIVNGEV